MIDVEPVIREELQRRVPPVDPAIANWRDILDRSGEMQRRRRRRLAATVVVGAAAVALAASPLGGAVTDAIGGFSDWLRGTPGAPTTLTVQRQFDAANFPGSPQLRELMHVTLEGHRFVLYGFTTRQVVCLRLVVRKLGTGPQTACVSRAELRRTRDPVLPVKGNLTISKYAVTFGLAAHAVTRIAVLNDRGTSRAVLRNGAFLSVFHSGRRDDLARTVIARSGQRRPVIVPLSVQTSSRPPLHTGLRPHGPSRVTRTVSGGTIGWFVHREARGLSPARAHVRIRGCCRGYPRDPARSR